MNMELPRSNPGTRLIMPRASLTLRYPAVNPIRLYTEWYSMEDIKRLYGLKQGYVSNLIYKNPIPKMRAGTKVSIQRSISMHSWRPSSLVRNITLQRRRWRDSVSDTTRSIITLNATGSTQFVRGVTSKS